MFLTARCLEEGVGYSNLKHSSVGSLLITMRDDFKTHPPMTGGKTWLFAIGDVTNAKCHQRLNEILTFFPTLHPGNLQSCL